jgi:hypothetical protein
MQRRCPGQLGPKLRRGTAAGPPVPKIVDFGMAKGLRGALALALGASPIDFLIGGWLRSSERRRKRRCGDGADDHDDDEGPDRRHPGVHEPGAVGGAS